MIRTFESKERERIKYYLDVKSATLYRRRTMEKSGHFTWFYPGWYSLRIVDPLALKQRWRSWYQISIAISLCSKADYKKWLKLMFWQIFMQSLNINRAVKTAIREFPGKQLYLHRAETDKCLIAVKIKKHE